MGDIALKEGERKKPTLQADRFEWQFQFQVLISKIFITVKRISVRTALVC